MDTTQLGSNSGKLVNALAALVALEMEIHSLTTKYAKLTEVDKASLRDGINKWFNKALEIAREFKPREFTISVEIGIPP